MPRQSITLSENNDEWLKKQADGREYHSKSEVINAIIRDARAVDEDNKRIRAALIEGEKSERVSLNFKTFREKVKQDMRAAGEL